MDHLDNQTLARLCRVQAKIASTEGTRSALIELALLYERAPEGTSIVDLMKALPKQPE
jgi:hypothetical protein